MGAAFHYGHRDYFAEIVQAAVDGDGRLTLDEVWTVGEIDVPCERTGGIPGREGLLVRSYSTMVESSACANSPASRLVAVSALMNRMPSVQRGDGQHRALRWPR